MNILKLKTKFKILVWVKKALRIDKQVTTTTHEQSEAVMIRTMISVDSNQLSKPGGVKSAKQALLAQLLIHLMDEMILETSMRVEPRKRLTHVSGGLIVLIDKNHRLKKP